MAVHDIRSKYKEGDLVTDGQIVGTVYIVHSNGEYSLDLGHTTAVRREEDLYYAPKTYLLTEGEYQFMQYMLEKGIKAINRTVGQGLEPLAQFAIQLKGELLWQHEYGEREPVHDGTSRL